MGTSPDEYLKLKFEVRESLWKLAVAESKKIKLPAVKVYYYLVSEWAERQKMQGEKYEQWVYGSIDQLISEVHKNRLGTCRNEKIFDEYGGDGQPWAVLSCSHCGWKFSIIILEMLKEMRPQAMRLFSQTPSAYRVKELRSYMWHEIWGFYSGYYITHDLRDYYDIPSYERKYINEQMCEQYYSNPELMGFWYAVSQELLSDCEA